MAKYNTNPYSRITPTLKPQKTYTEKVQVRKQIKNLYPGEQITLIFQELLTEPGKWQIYSEHGELFFMATLPEAEISEHFTPVDLL